MADVVGSYLKLERAGVNWKARCPFHNEKTPSFFVSPGRGTYHCFGCNRGGDIFSFVEEIEGVQFQDALKLLADKAGVTLRQTDPKQKLEHDKLYALVDCAALYYEERLRENNEALLYLKNRGLTDESIHAWRLGFALDSWGGLYNFLKGKGYGDEDIDKAGFVVMGERGYYDRFRARIMFPLANASGKIVGFSGRIFLPYDKKKENELAKYVNSPDTVLYNKSRILYGYDKAKADMMRENAAVLVEGQMDLLMSHQAGVNNSIALSGTALTEEHLRMIKRFSDNLIIALDSDQAGFKASERAYKLATALGLDVRVAKLPKGLDPAEQIKGDAESWKKIIGEAKHIIEYLLEEIKERGYDDRTFRVEAGKRVLPYVAEIGNKIDQAHFVGRLAGELDMREEHLWEELRKIKQNAGIPPSLKAEEKPPGLFRKELITRKIAGIILWQGGEKEPKIDIKRAEKHYEELVVSYGIQKIIEMKAGDMIFESEMYYAGHDNLDREVGELIRNLERELLEEQFSNAMHALAEAEKRGRLDEAEELLKKCQELSGKINIIKTRFHGEFI